MLSSLELDEIKARLAKFPDGCTVEAESTCEDGWCCPLCEGEGYLTFKTVDFVESAAGFSVFGVGQAIDDLTDLLKNAHSDMKNLVQTVEALRERLRKLSCKGCFEDRIHECYYRGF